VNRVGKEGIPQGLKPTGFGGIERPKPEGLGYLEAYAPILEGGAWMLEARVMLINTCGVEGVVALAEGASVVAEERLPGRGSSEHLMPAVRGLMEGQGWRVRELGAVGVVIGPGSFTGVRVGLSAAKGLCEAGGVKMVAMSRLELVARSYASESHVSESRHGAPSVVAVLDAGRGEYFCGVYRDGECVSEEMLGLEAVREILLRGRGVTCEARVAQSLGIGVELVAEPGAEAMLALARRRIEASAWNDVAAVDANYLRRTDAELLMMKGR